MLAKNHITMGVTGYLGAASLLSLLPVEPVMIAACSGFAFIGSGLPDIDHPKSKFGRLVPFISYLLSMVFGHRGITHSIFSVLGLIAVIMYLAVGNISASHSDIVSVCFALASGYAIHLFGDFFTNSGVPLLYPSKRRFSFILPFNTGSLFEYLFCAAFSLAALFVAVKTNDIPMILGI